MMTEFEKMMYAEERERLTKELLSSADHVLKRIAGACFAGIDKEEGMNVDRRRSTEYNTVYLDQRDEIYFNEERERVGWIYEDILMELQEEIEKRVGDLMESLGERYIDCASEVRVTKENEIELRGCEGAGVYGDRVYSMVADYDRKTFEDKVNRQKRLEEIR